MNIAVAFTGFNNNHDWELDPSYGEIIFTKYTWGIGQDGLFFEDRTKLKSHVCTPEQLGMIDGHSDDNMAIFFPPHPASSAFIKTYQKKFLCID